MAKRTKDDEKKKPRRVNVEVAPGNRTRLDRYLQVFNEDPDRKQSTKTLTDVINEALDAYFPESFADFNKVSQTFNSQNVKEE